MKPTKVQELFDNPEVDEYEDEDAEYIKQNVVKKDDEEESEEEHEEDEYEE